jgi:hypothetical protein
LTNTYNGGMQGTKTVIPRNHETYETRNNKHAKGRTWLAIGYDFKCAKQPLGSLYCGHYTCEHLRITGLYMINREKVSYHCVS